MARTGKEFLQGLKDDHQMWVDSERVRDVAAHPAFAGAARSVAALFDLQHEAADVCLMLDSETGSWSMSDTSFRARAKTSCAATARRTTAVPPWLRRRRRN
jgi:4-hydroxyphenylacetate 3-monooxygenase